MKQLTNYIDGAFTSTAETLDDVGPGTGEVIAHIPRSGAHEVDAAARAAQRASSGWGQTSMNERADLLDHIANTLHARIDTLAEMESLDTGKPIALASTVDIPRAIANFRFFAGAVRHMHTGFHEMAGAINYTLREPVGVVGLITPWNLPLYLLSWKAAPALAMGNTVICKPSELTPMTASALAEIMHEAGVPKGVFNLVHGLGAEAGQALVEHPLVQAISFTGGTETGANVGATAARGFKKMSLELGGKNPTIVFADCDFDKTVQGVVRAGFLNQGQVCLCGSRLFIERSIYPRFIEAVANRVQQMKVGDPADPGTELGAVISAGHRDKVEGYIELAKQEGGTIAAGGKRPAGANPRGFFLEPTLVTDLAPTCRTAQEEIFGPVVTAHAFDSEAEVLQHANSVKYGLSASVWTQDLNRAHRVSKGLHCGMVWVNTWLLRDLRVPFGGIKQSGVGREGGENSLKFFSEDKNVCIKFDA